MSTIQCQHEGCSQERMLFELYCLEHLRANNTNVPVDAYEKAFPTREDFGQTYKASNTKKGSCGKRFNGKHND